MERFTAELVSQLSLKSRFSGAELKEIFTYSNIMVVTYILTEDKVKGEHPDKISHLEFYKMNELVLNSKLELNINILDFMDYTLQNVAFKGIHYIDLKHGGVMLIKTISLDKDSIRDNEEYYSGKEIKTQMLFIDNMLFEDLNLSEIYLDPKGIGSREKGQKHSRRPYLFDHVDILAFQKLNFKLIHIIVATKNEIIEFTTKNSESLNFVAYKDYSVSPSMYSLNEPHEVDESIFVNEKLLIRVSSLDKRVMIVKRHKKRSYLYVFELGQQIDPILVLPSSSEILCYLEDELFVYDKYLNQIVSYTESGMAMFLDLNQFDSEP
jgi:hypothetical protein